MAEDKSLEMSKHETDVLLGLYSGCECLWNTKNPDFKDKKIRIGAIRTIINGMRLETGRDFSTSQMQMALDSIHKKYSQELKQVMEGENSTSGNGYKCQWRWFQFLDSFLRDNVLHAEKIDLDTSCEKEGEDEARLGVAVEEDESNDTDDYFCATVDSGDEDYQPPTASKRQAHMQVLPTRSCPSSSSTLSSSSRPVRASSRRVDMSSVMNGGGLSNNRSTPSVHNSRKRRSQNSVNSTSVTKGGLSSSSAVGGADRGASLAFSRHGSGSSSTTLPHWRNASNPAGQRESPVEGQMDGLRISSQIAETLKAVQILLATSLTDQDQPSMVFARHLANELQQIQHYTQRKQCMLELQQVILRYQTKQQDPDGAMGLGAGRGGAQIKFEGSRSDRNHEITSASGESSVGGGGGGGGLGVSSGSRGGSTSSTVTQQQCSEDALLLYFESP